MSAPTGSGHGDPHRPRHLIAVLTGLVALAFAATVLAIVGTGSPSASSAPMKAPPPLVGTGAPLSSAYVGRPCFGAAAHDPLRPCVNRGLRLVVTPPPARAELERNAVCAPEDPVGLLLPCAFGVPAASARDTFALIGDSHASVWRAPLQRVAEAEHWRGISLTRSSCPLNSTPALLPGPAGPECVHWNALVLGWLRGHPEVHTVFLAQHSGGRVLHPVSMTGPEAQAAGYRQTWTALPASVRRIFVIRDTPRGTARSAACIARAVARGVPAGTACAVPRSFALKPDPALAAALAGGLPRVRVVNLTRYMCDLRLCPPVIGGALVHRDIDHLTQTFAATLAPYLQARIEAVLARTP